MAIAALVFGVWLVAVSEWNFTDTWIVLGLVGIAITIVTGAGFLGPEADRLGKASGSGALPTPRSGGGSGASS